MNLVSRSARMMILAAAVMAAAPAMAADHAVTIKGFAFSPATLTVAAGDTVTFTNEDSAPHTATAGDGSFDTGRLNKGASATVTIAGAGNHAYKCNFHASMKGTISAN
ncbi:MAG: copper-binding protein [Ahrensia sp.]|nr:copper-binding protein [Ahrensia sp.]|tara:strand:+ start:2037 stop:2360 length:324 start_codon:yes stop_codon:yes gene_type:complete